MLNEAVLSGSGERRLWFVAHRMRMPLSIGTDCLVHSPWWATVQAYAFKPGRSSLNAFTFSSGKRWGAAGWSVMYSNRLRAKQVGSLIL